MNYSWELSPFDTEIFGFKTAKITYVQSYVSDLIHDFKKAKITYATCRISANDYSVIQSLEENGFILVDGLITLTVDLNTDQEIGFTPLKEATSEDHMKLINVAGSIFRGISRYYHDPVISTEKADNIYRQWMKNSLDGTVADVVLVSREMNDISGFITVQKKGQIPLIGVTEKVRGTGIGKKLIQTALATCKNWGLHKVLIETQMTNISALRLYHSCGFKIVSSHLTFRWHSSLT
jgi:dTDP-4-amino-4,6-dideoxy-D-galactose acyltransferase